MTGQTIIVLVIVAICAVIAIRFMARKVAPPKGGNENCSTCKGCPVSDACKSDKKTV